MQIWRGAGLSMCGVHGAGSSWDLRLPTSLEWNVIKILSQAQHLRLAQASRAVAH